MLCGYTHKIHKRNVDNSQKTVDETCANVENQNTTLFFLLAFYDFIIRAHARSMILFSARP